MATLHQLSGRHPSFARIVHGVRSRLLGHFETLNSCAGVFESFAHAATAVPETKPLGYDEANTTDWYLWKMNTISLEDYPVIFWLRDALQHCRSIIEIGGHIGEAFYAFSRVLTYPADLDWTICDVPSVIKVGRSLAEERGASNLSFVSTPTQTKGADIFLACGSLQYFDARSPAEIIARYSVRPRHVLINTSPIYDGPSFVTIQNIGSAFCLYRVFNRQHIVRSMDSLGYTLVDTWRRDRKFRIPHHPECSFEHYTGMYLRLN